jgi:hypothetical protein
VLSYFFAFLALLIMPISLEAFDDAYRACIYYFSGFLLLLLPVRISFLMLILMVLIIPLLLRVLMARTPRVFSSLRLARLYY